MVVVNFFDLSAVTNYHRNNTTSLSKPSESGISRFGSQCDHYTLFS